MNPDLDTLMRDAGAPPPADFSASVMRRIADLPQPMRTPRRWTRVWQLAWLAATLAGFIQALSFIFGLWAVTAAAAA